MYIYIYFFFIHACTSECYILAEHAVDDFTYTYIIHTLIIKTTSNMVIAHQYLMLCCVNTIILSGFCVLWDKTAVSVTECVDWNTLA